MLESSESFSCPNCSEQLIIRIDLTAGKKQRFVYDCEVCCSPIVCTVEIEGGEVVNFSAEKEV